MRVPLEDRFMIWKFDPFASDGQRAAVFLFEG
jgi:hypothetical protein